MSAAIKTGACFILQEMVMIKTRRTFTVDWHMSMPLMQTSLKKKSSKLNGGQRLEESQIQVVGFCFD